MAQATPSDTWSSKFASGSRWLNEPLEVSPNDSRQYRMLKLENGLKALLISDARTDKAAAALGVQVGHLSDPDDLPGLAHFCEHMLFLGTERFPDEAEYKTYLSRNAGSSNAYTSLAETVYHFDVNPAGLPGALARHAQFFTRPLFAESCTEREVHAVDSEFRRNLQLDARRLFQLGKSTSSRSNGAVYHKFGTGSKETLWSTPLQDGQDVRARLIEWYKAHYSANLMNLVVLSSHSLEELASLVEQEYGNVPTADRARPSFPIPPITDREGGREISYRTVKDVPQLRIEFGLPDLSHLSDTKPGQFISHYVGHEGPGTILAELKLRGWATALSSSCSGGANGFDFFRIGINLTRDGLDNYRQVVALALGYVELLKSTDPQEWSFAETQQLGKVAWRWKENGQPRDTVRNLASAMCDEIYALPRILSGPYYATRWDPTAVKFVLDALNLSRCRVFVGSKDPLPGRAFWHSAEQYYGTEYDVTLLDVPVLPSDANLSLPERNVFVPTELKLLCDQPVSTPATEPDLLRNKPSRRVFHKSDDTWCIPRGTAYLLIKSPTADDTPRNAMLTQLFASLVEEELASISYDATLAGLHYSLGTERAGVLLAVSGYTDKLPLLARMVMDKMRSLQLGGQEFNVVHDRLSRAYANARLANPYSLADIELKRFTRSTFWTHEERLEALQNISREDVLRHAERLLSSTELDVLVHGNLTSEDAVDLVKIYDDVFRAGLADHHHRGLLLPEGHAHVYRPHVPSPENVNSAASVLYQVGSAADDQLVSRLSLFAQIAKVPVFSTLRTKEQLGYIVSSGVMTHNAVAGFRVVVQSEKSPEYLDERIEALWSGFGQYLADLSEESFGKEKESLVNLKLEQPKNLAQESSRYFEQIRTGAYDFSARVRRAGIIRNLTKDDLTAFFERFISPASGRRAKLAVLLRSLRFQPDALQELVADVGRLEPDRRDDAQALAEQKPILSQIEAFVTGLSDTAREQLTSKLSALRTPPPLPAGSKEIGADQAAVDAFRRGLPLAEPYRPHFHSFSPAEHPRL